MAQKRTATAQRILNANVIVGALGYFVDIYDLLLFGIVRVASLRSIGVPEEKLLEEGVFLINSQMMGLLIGGILWGVLGDKKGRISVLFGSIFLYSVANIANAFVTTVEMYAILRFIAGIGLAGELGAAITLVSETMPKETRGYGTAIVAAVGILGAVVAALVGDMFSWQTAYIVGGVMGLLLLGLRVSMFESGLFQTVQESDCKRGDVRMLFYPRERFFRYLRCILIGVPLWFVVGILMTFSPELAKALGIVGVVSAGKAIMWGYAGLSVGDLASGFISQRIGSRKKVVGASVLLTALLIVIYVNAFETTPNMLYTLCFLLGISCGYWAVFVTVAAEQFGTNLRATVATTVPNFVRGSVVIITLSFKALSDHVGLLSAALIVGLVTVVIALVSLHFMKETFAHDLNYLES